VAHATKYRNPKRNYKNNLFIGKRERAGGDELRSWWGAERGAGRGGAALFLFEGRSMPCLVNSARGEIREFAWRLERRDWGTF